MKRKQLASFALALMTAAVLSQTYAPALYLRGTTALQYIQTGDDNDTAESVLLSGVSSFAGDAEQEIPPLKGTVQKVEKSSAAKQMLHTLERFVQEVEESSAAEQEALPSEEAMPEADEPDAAEQEAPPSKEATQEADEPAEQEVLPSEEATQEADKPSVMEHIATAGNAKRIDVTNILQKPALPTGCETVSLTILLNHLGYAADALTIARTYLPKMDFYTLDGANYGADFRTTFAGDPESSHAYGCYAPCIVTTANAYFRDNEIDRTARDLTGTDFDSLLTEYIDQDIPVLIWITSSKLHAPKPTTVWTTPEGEKVQWLAYEHCVVLTGYDKEKQLIYVADPLVGNTSYDYSKIKQRYVEMGQNCVSIP